MTLRRPEWASPAAATGNGRKRFGEGMLRSGAETASILDDGFKVFPGLLAAFIHDIGSEFDRVMAAWRPTDLTDRFQVRRFLQLDSRFDGGDWLPIVAGAIQDEIGAPVSLLASEGSLLRGDTTWHRDGSTAPGLLFKANLYLDATRSESGALHVISGSHRSAAPAELARSEIAVMPSSPGDVCVFDMAAIHGAPGGDRTRRVLNLIFSRSPRGQEDQAAIRDYVMAANAVL